MKLELKINKEEKIQMDTENLFMDNRFIALYNCPTKEKLNKSLYNIDEYYNKNQVVYIKNLNLDICKNIMEENKIYIIQDNHHYNKIELDVILSILDEELKAWNSIAIIKTSNVEILQGIPRGYVVLDQKKEIMKYNTFGDQLGNINENIEFQLTGDYKIHNNYYLKKLRNFNEKEKNDAKQIKSSSLLVNSFLL